MGRIFEGLTLLLIGISDILAVQAVQNAVAGGWINNDSLGGLAILGFILAIAGSIWAVDGVLKKYYKIK